MIKTVYTLEYKDTDYGWTKYTEYLIEQSVVDNYAALPDVMKEKWQWRKTTYETTIVHIERME